MRTTIAIATFLAAGASVAAVSGATLSMVGSDTLKEVTIDVLNLSTPYCGGLNQVSGGVNGTLQYVGTGSGNGQSALTGGTQQVAPMSRPLNGGAGICTNANNVKAEGIVHSLDGVAVAANSANWSTCNGTVSPTCAQDSAHGLANSLTVTPDSPAVACTVDADCNNPTRPGVFGEHCDSATNTCQYTFRNWKHVLRILFAGQGVEVVPFDPVTGLLPECSTDADCGLAEQPSGTTQCVADTTSSTGKRCVGTASNNFRNCGSPERKFLAANYNRVFQSCSTGNCTSGIQHAFRRNDESGTTDVFVTLLSLPAINQGGNVTPFCNARTQGPKTASSTACTPFGTQSDVDPFTYVAGAGGGFLNPPLGNINLDPPTHIAVAAATYRGEYWTDMQDADVIRRTCAQPQEDVCEARGDLGLVLPVWDIPDTVAQVDAFPVKTCSNGAFVCASTNEATCPDGRTPAAEAQCGGAGTCAFAAYRYDYKDDANGVPCNVNADCGSAAGAACDTTSHRCSIFSCNTDADCTGNLGHTATACTTNSSCPVATTAGVCDTGAGLCFGKNYANPIPVGMCAVDSGGVKSCGGALTSRTVNDPRCNSTRGETLPASAAKFDPRVYNLTTWQQNTAGTFGSFTRVLVPRSTGLVPPCTSQKTVQNVPMVGGFYRIHSVHSFGTQGGSAVICQTNSSTEQIGCLVQASPCSIGYAGRESVGVSVNGVNNAIALKNDGVDPQDQCIRNLIASPANPAVGTLYPLSRKLFLNTLKGFGSVTGDELALADCMSQRSVIDPIVTAHGFVTLSAATSGTGYVPAFCQDFDEHAVCAVGTANTDACHDSPTNPSPIPDCENGDTAGTNCNHFGP